MQAGVIRFTFKKNDGSFSVSHDANYISDGKDPTSGKSYNYYVPTLAHSGFVGHYGDYTITISGYDSNGNYYPDIEQTNTPYTVTIDTLNDINLQSQRLYPNITDWNSSNTDLVGSSHCQLLVEILPCAA